MPVYFIRAGEDGPIKIGYAANPRKRLHTVQTAHWQTVRLVRLIDGGRDVERELHSRYQHLHIRGEWFLFDASMLNVGAEIPHPAVPGRDESVHKALTKMGGATALGRAIGVSRQAIGHWRSIPIWHVRKVAEVTGIPLSELMADHPRPPIGDDDSGECGEQGAS